MRQVRRDVNPMAIPGITPVFARPSRAWTQAQTQGTDDRIWTAEPTSAVGILSDPACMVTFMPVIVIDAKGSRV